jgi:N-acetylmuramoyl-L-alanine amidase
VLKPEKFLPGLLLVLAGCYTGPHSSAPDWSEKPSAPTEIEHVTEGPLIAPPKDIPLPGLAIRTNLTYADTWISLNRWNRENHIGSLEQITPAPNRTFALTTSNGVLVIQAHSLVARWSGVEFRLGFEPQLIDEQPFVHVLDLKKNIEPLLRRFTLPPKINRVVVIDPGHGGMNAGTKSLADGSNEKEWTLDLALRLEPLLATNGWQVFLTRRNDSEVPLPARVAFADQHEADLFISLHFNSAAPSREQAGLETFCLTPTGMRSTLIREYEDNSSLVFTNNAFDAQNLQYALLLHRALLECDFTDRGVRRARFLGVLRGQNRPAVLIESGYLSNPAEARRIADPDFRQQMAEAIAEALK